MATPKLKWFREFTSLRAAKQAITAALAKLDAAPALDTARPKTATATLEGSKP